MDDRAPLYLALAGVVAPILSVQAVSRAAAAGLLPPVAVLGLLLAAASMTIGLVASGWFLGVKGGDPFDRFRSRQTLRDKVPEAHQAALHHEQLDEELEEPSMPRWVFVYGLAYAAGLAVFTAVALL